MIEKIGFNAGRVWEYLELEGRANIKDVKKATKLTEKDLHSALGWLAREGKLHLEAVEKEVFAILQK